MLAITGLILSIYSLAIQINDWKKDWGKAICSEDDNSASFEVNDKLELTEIWDNLSATILVSSIVAFIAGLVTFLTERSYIIDKDGNTKKDLENWKVSTTRLLCRCHIILWFLIFVLIVVWFWMMVVIVAGLDQVANAKNCSSDTVKEAAGDKLLAFGFLIAVALIGGLCCGVPMICVMMFGRPDDAKDDNDNK